MINYYTYRPNGKLYRPRKPPRAIVFDEEGHSDESVLVLGTHDIKHACEVAELEVKRMLGSGLKPGSPDKGWYIEKYRNGELTWVYDDVKGQAGVWFNEILDA